MIVENVGEMKLQRNVRMLGTTAQCELIDG